MQVCICSSKSNKIGSLAKNSISRVHDWIICVSASSGLERSQGKHIDRWLAQRRVLIREADWL